MPPEAVLDTNVFIAGLRSRRGASYRLLDLLETKVFVPVLSDSLIAEYESVGVRVLAPVGFNPINIRDAVDVVIACGRYSDVYFKLRPALPDPGDESILELAFSAGSIPIVTFNTKHFRGAERYGVEVLTPAEFLERLGG